MSTGDRLSDLFLAACDLPKDQRQPFIERETEAGSPLRARLEALLAADDAPDHQSFWNHPAIEHEAMAEASTPDSLVGARIGAYRIVEVLGAGGMGTVYRAVRDDAEYDQDVAIKRLRRGMDADLIVARFRAERQILATLDHPNIARLLDGGSDREGLPYLVMEFVKGTSPDAYSEAHGLDIAGRLRLFLPICDAVHYAHQRMVIHRDIKPPNILITTDGTPKLLDFGIAALIAEDGEAGSSPVTEVSGPALTPRYASPEQIKGLRITTASDVYSLGVCLYELLTGRSPYRNPSTSAVSLLAEALGGELLPASQVRADLRGDIENILAKALAADPNQRYASVDQFAEDLRRFLSGRPVIARGDAWSYVAWKFTKRNKALVLAAALVVISLVGGIITTTRAQARADRRFEDVRRLARSVVFDYHDAIFDLPGALPVRERLVKDALQYLDSLSSEVDDVSLQRELIDSYVRISRTQGNSYYSNLNDAEGAKASAAKAVALAERIRTRDTSAATAHSVAAAFESEGDLQYERGELQAAEASYARAREFYERALAQTPDDVSLLLNFTSFIRHQGDLFGGQGIQNLGRTSDAIEAYRLASQMSARAVQLKPDDGSVRHQHYQMVYTLAGVEVTAGRVTEAMAGFEEAARLIEIAITKRPDNLLDKQELAFVSLRYGQLLMDQGKFAEATPRIQRSLSIMEDNAAKDPKNSSTARNLSVVRGHYARALRESGHGTEALQQNQIALKTYLELTGANPSSAFLRGDAAIGRKQIAETLVTMNRIDEAMPHLAQSIAILEELGANDANFRAHRARALVVRGDARAKAGDAAGARADYQAARDIFAAMAAADAANATIRTELASAEAKLSPTPGR